uniref:Ig-like domain-containing protein n=1 Tax=Macrostomum lignano TaxID=282301 RepID=A0A1I8FR69_9PLAT
RGRDQDVVLKGNRSSSRKSSSGTCPPWRGRTHEPAGPCSAADPLSSNCTSAADEIFKHHQCLPAAVLLLACLQFSSPIELARDASGFFITTPLTKTVDQSDCSDQAFRHFATPSSCLRGEAKCTTPSLFENHSLLHTGAPAQRPKDNCERAVQREHETTTPRLGKPAADVEEEFLVQLKQLDEEGGATELTCRQYNGREFALKMQFASQPQHDPVLEFHSRWYWTAAPSTRIEFPDELELPYSEEFPQSLDLDAQLPETGGFLCETKVDRVPDLAKLSSVLLRMETDSVLRNERQNGRHCRKFSSWWSSIRVSGLLPEDGRSVCCVALTVDPGGSRARVVQRRVLLRCEPGRQPSVTSSASVGLVSNDATPAAATGQRFEAHILCKLTGFEVMLGDLESGVCQVPHGVDPRQLRSNQLRSVHAARRCLLKPLVCEFNMAQGYASMAWSNPAGELCDEDTKKFDPRLAGEVETVALQATDSTTFLDEIQYVLIDGDVCITSVQFEGKAATPSCCIN